MNQEYTLLEAAESVGATVDQLRYWISLMGIESARRGKCRFIAEEDVSRLRGMASMVKSGTAPKEAAMLARERPTEAVVVAAPVEPPSIINDYQRALVLLAEDNRQIKQTLSAILEEVKSVRGENSTLRGQVAQLMPPKQDEKLFDILKRPPEPVKCWSPTPKPDPLAGEGIFARVWTHLVRPERLRRFVEN